MAEQEVIHTFSVDPPVLLALESCFEKYVELQRELLSAKKDQTGTQYNWIYVCLWVGIVILAIMIARGEI